jgi:hypothetical protein
VATHTLEGEVRSVKAGAPLFLVGPARSGTTLLYKLLCLHPRTSYVSNYVARVPRLPWLAVLDRVPRHAAATQRRVWFGGESSNAYVYGAPRPLLDRLFPMPVEGEPVFRAAGLSPTGLAEGKDPDEAAARLRRSIARIAGSAGGTFVNKRIANIYRIPELHRAFPDARFVALNRDGRAVALSLSKVDWWPDSTVVHAGTTPRAWAAAGGDPWELCARNWIEELAAMEAGLEAVPGDQVLRLSYEELVGDPFPRLEDIARFAGLDPSTEWRRRLGQVSFPNRNQAWSGGLAPEALATVEAIQRDVLARYGYAD